MKRPKHPGLLSLMYMTWAAGGFAVMAAFAKVLSARGMPYLEVAFFRAFIAGVITVVLSAPKGISLKVHNRKAMVSRVSFGTASMIATFHAIAYLPLADASALFNSTPIWLALLGWIVLGERVSPRVLAALAIAPLGVVLLLRPTLEGLVNGGVALSAAIFAAAAMVSLRRLGNDRPDTVVIYFSFAAALVIGALGASRFVMPSPKEWLLALGCGASASVAQLWMTQAFALDRAARVGGAEYLRLIFSATIGILIFGETLSLHASLGIALLLLTGALLALDAYYEARALTPTSQT